MSDFDPNVDPETQAQADAYVDWCAENLMRLATSEQTYRTAQRCVAWLFVVASAQLHLDEDVEHNRDALLEQLAMYQQLGRAIERQRDHYAVERLIIMRSSLDCWEPAGESAGALLLAARCAVSAMILIELHPLVDLWDMPCPDVWALIDNGIDALAHIEGIGGLSFEDFSIRPDEMVLAKFTWQKAQGIARRLGGPPMSQN